MAAHERRAIAFANAAHFWRHAARVL